MAGGAWLATTAATVASTYALDGFAVAVGALVVGSGVLDGLTGAQVAVCLAASYGLWGLGLRVSLAANWSMLSTTGVSTNALSKAAHDLAQTRSVSVRTRRFAASIGYLCTELAKELPYYLSAGGAALSSDSVSSRDALIFLAGTNVGAALYEYGLAWATRAFLRRRSGSAVAMDKSTVVSRGREPAEELAQRAGAPFSSV
jgi:hypothetical protein